MKKINTDRYSRLTGVLILLVITCALSFTAMAQTNTAGGTTISNKASATYQDPGGSTYTTESNTVVTTVSYVAGLAITPDSGTLGSSVTPGSTVSYTFTVRNSGNFADNVRFLASGASIVKSGTGAASGTVSAAFIDVDGNGTFGGTDVDILGNGADVLHSLGQGGTATDAVAVVVRVAVAAGATGGQTVIITLGDTATGGPTFDNQAATTSANEVRTSHPAGITAVNGDREAKGDITGTISNVGAVLNGPQGSPNATGGTPADNNHDYTNKSTDPSATNTPVTFTNTIQNTGNSADTFTLSVPAGSFPAGATVVIDPDGAGPLAAVTVISGGVATATPTATTGSIAAAGTQNYTVIITLPSGATTLTANDTVIRATSGNTPTSSNDTIDRVYTGFLRLTKSATVTNSTGIGAATDPVPGAVIEYAIVYANITPAATGAGSVELNATNIVITENGNAAPNDWGTKTDHVAGSATDTNSGGIVGDAAGSTLLTDTVAGPLAPNTSGTFRFRRTIK